MIALSYLTIALYAVVSTVFVAYLFKRDDHLRALGRLLVLGLLAVHVAAIGSFCVRGVHPLTGLSSVLNLIAFVLMAAYWLIGLRVRMGVGGALVTPLAFCLVVSGQLTPAGPPIGGAPAVLGKLHLSLVAMGVAALALATVVSIAYLRLAALLRRNQLAVLDRGGPALTTLDGIGLRLTLIGAPLFLLAVITGLFWSAQLPGGLTWRVEHLLSGGILVLFGVLIVARLTVGWRGRKAALLTLASFTVTALVLAIYLARRLVV